MMHPPGAPERVVLRPRSILSRIFPVLGPAFPQAAATFFDPQGISRAHNANKEAGGHQCCFPQCGARAKEADTAGKESCPWPCRRIIMLSFMAGGGQGPTGPQEWRVTRDAAVSHRNVSFPAFR